MGGWLPVAVTAKTGKQVVSEDSSARVMLVALVAVVAVVAVVADVAEVAVSALPVKLPTNDDAVSAPVLELNVRFVPDLGGRFPVAAVTNSGKQVVSEDSSATVTFVEVVAVSALPVTSPVKSPTNDEAVTTPVALIPPVIDTPEAVVINF